MTAPVPDPQRETVEQMAARYGLPVELLNAPVRWTPQAPPPVPDPHFRDQLAEAIPAWVGLTHDEPTLLADALMPTIAAEVEARVQAAANQRAAEGVTPTEIARQRTLGWPDFHPEDYCHQCGRPNPNWFADTEAWQLTTESTGDGGGILCPSCFATLWEAKTGLTAIVWRLSIGAGRDAARAAALASPAPAPHAEEGR